ncbi:N-acetyl sugar amidotransferase [Alphaproteobacteria bacterium]|nr:N-acetyl sugar amidotransferase [Alphaproteobacteria bacterium]
MSDFSLYGLPEEVHFCKSCVMSNQRPSSAVEFKNNINIKKQTISFGDNGVCDACTYAEKKRSEVDWEKRENELKQMLDKYRSRNSSYDVLVPGSGGKDSVYASHILKYKYGMRPLTVTWSPHLYTDIGWQNFQNWLHCGGFDNYLFTPNGIVHRKLTELAYKNLLHPFQPFILGQKNFAPKIAAKLNIPLVIYGENEAEYGNPIDENKESVRSSHYFTMEDDDMKDIYLGGEHISEFSKHGITIDDLAPYFPGKASELEVNNTKVHYLGYYLKWTPQECYYYSVDNVKFEANPERTEGTYSKYNSIDDKTDGFHYWTTFIKFGVGRTTYDASQEIRNNHLTRDEGIALVKKYDGEFPERYFEEFLEYISVSREEFFDIADKFRSPHLWQKNADGWSLKHKIFDQP